MNAPLIQRKCACGGSCDSCRKDEPRVQRRATGVGPASVPRAARAAMQSQGRALDPDTRARFESRFAHSFTDVRVHADSQAAGAAREIDAAAYTSGSHIVFGANRYEPHTDRGRRLLAHELTHVVQQRSGAASNSGIGPAGDAFEREADRVANDFAGDSPLRVSPAIDGEIRRQRDEESPEPQQAPQQRWIVEDRELPVPGQMRRRDFLDELHTAICATADTEMARLGRSTAGCPLLDKWQAFSKNKNAAQLETSARRYAAEAERVRSARDYIPIITRKISQSIGEWGRTGRIPDVPPDLAADFGLGKIKVGVGSLLSGLAGGLVGGMFGGRKAADDTTGGSNVSPWLTVRGGRPLESGVASRMSSALGRDFSDVRVHTDAEGASTATAAGARALTIGRDIAFAAGQYQPGSLVGDALLAHELAHVSQQDGASGPMLKGDDASSAPLEHDADDAAVNAVVSLWGRTTKFARELGTKTGPRLKSGLRLQRCSDTLPVKQESANRKVDPVKNPACPPTLGTLKMDIDSAPRLLTEGGGSCRLTLEHVVEGQAAEGMQIHGSIGVAPNCPGRVYFAQYTKVQRSKTGCADSTPQGTCVNAGWGIDALPTALWPYANASRIDDLTKTPGTQKVWSGDSPAERNISGDHVFPGFARVCMRDQFVTYLVYENGSQQLMPLAWMSWQQVGSAARDGGKCPARGGGGCEGWEITGSTKAEKTGESLVAGAMHPTVPLAKDMTTVMDPKTVSVVGGSGGGSCAPESCPPGGWS